MPITNRENQCEWCKQFMISDELRGKVGGVKICLDCAYGILVDKGFIKWKQHQVDKQNAKKSKS